MSKKRLFLHICCAPDASVGYERLSDEWDAEGFFLNSNIHPDDEYARRLNALRSLAGKMGFTFTEGPYEPEAWFQSVRGLEGESEKGLRCAVCIRERLRATARRAKEEGFDAFAAVLTVSPHKNAEMVNSIGQQCAEEFGIEYLATDLKKKDGFKRSVQLTRQYGIYRQNYCGCEFSKRKDAVRSTPLDQARDRQDAEEKT